MPAAYPFVVAGLALLTPEAEPAFRLDAATHVEPE
jgi:hypothetical protein